MRMKKTFQYKENNYKHVFDTFQLAVGTECSEKELDGRVGYLYTTPGKYEATMGNYVNSEPNFFYRQLGATEMMWD